MQANLAIYKYVLLEIILKVNGSGTRINFPVNNYLTNTQTVAVEVYSSNDLVYSPVTAGLPVATIDILREASLTIHGSDPQITSAITNSSNKNNIGDWLKQIPLTRLHTNFNTNSTASGTSNNHIWTASGMVVDWNNSFIEFARNYSVEEDTSVLFGVYYRSLKS